MILFLLFLFPIASIWLISGDLFFRQTLIDLRNYFLFGILLFIPSFFFVSIFISFLNQTYSVLNIYLYHLFADYFFFQFFCILVCRLRFRNMMYSGSGEGISHYFLFIAGYYTAFTFYSAIQNYTIANIYTLFLNPITLLIMAIYTAVFLTFKDSETGFLKYIFTAGLFIFPVISAFVPFFFYIRFPLVSYIILFVMAAPIGYVLYKNSFNI